MKGNYLLRKSLGEFLAYILLVFYRAVIAEYFWNWFARPTLHVEFSYLQWLGLLLFIGIFLGEMGIKSPSEVKSWRLLISALELFVPQEKRESLKEISSSWSDAPNEGTAMHLGSWTFALSVTLLLGYLLHVLLR